MNKKKILHIVPTFELGGVQMGILYSLEELNKDCEYKVLVIGRIDKEWLKNLPIHLQEHILHSGATNIFSGWFKAYRILKNAAPDYIISSLWKSVILSVIYKLLNPYVYLFGFYHNAYPAHFLGDIFLKLMTLNEDAALADSAETKIFLKKRYKINNVSVVPYNFKFEKKGFKRNFFNPSYIKLAYFGRLTQIKGVDRSLEFCKLCKEAGINFSFELYGDGTNRGYNKRDYAEKIKKIGVEKEIIPSNLVLEKMYEYDFLLQLSDKEGMALSVVEAMNCGLVPIVTPVGEIGKYSQDGINAIWLDPDFDKNLPSLVEKLKKVLSDITLYNKMSLSTQDTFKNYKKYSEALTEAIRSNFDKN